MNVGDLLEIHFENWLQSLRSRRERRGRTPRLGEAAPFKQLTRYAGIHVNGLELVPAEQWAAQTASRATAPGSERIRAGCCNPDRPPNNRRTKQSITYRLYARDTGTFLLTSGADTTVHQLDAGLFGAVNVQPQGAEWYRSQTTRCEMEAATLEKRRPQSAGTDAGRSA